MYWQGVGALQAQLFLCKDNPAEAPICKIYGKFKSGKNICSRNTAWVYFHCTLISQSDGSDLSALFYQGLKRMMSKDSFIPELCCLNPSNVLRISWLNPHFKHPEPMSRSFSAEVSCCKMASTSQISNSVAFLRVSAVYTDKMCVK